MSGVPAAKWKNTTSSGRASSASTGCALSATIGAITRAWIRLSCPRSRRQVSSSNTHCETASPTSSELTSWSTLILPDRLDLHLEAGAVPATFLLHRDRREPGALEESGEGRGRQHVEVRIALVLLGPEGRETQVLERVPPLGVGGEHRLPVGADDDQTSADAQQPLPVRDERALGFLDRKVLDDV